MYEVVLDASSNLSVTDFIARIRAIIAGVRSRPGFASLEPLLLAIEAKVDNLETKEAALTLAKSALLSATSARDDSRDDVAGDLPQLASSLGETATSEAELLAATVRIKSAPTKRPAPAAPTALELTVGDEDGELTGHCDGQPGIVDFYEIQFTQTDPNLPTTVWQFADTSQRSSFELKNLPTGQKIWVRLRACNTTAKSPWSDPACKRVP